MNFSRYIYLKTLVTSVIEGCSEWSSKLSSSRWERLPLNLQPLISLFSSEDQRLRLFLGSIEKIIRSKVQEIHSKQEGGYWPVTKGDNVFIKYMNDTVKAIDGVLANPPISRDNLHALIDRLEQILIGIESEHTPKIKAVFLAQETSTWPSFESVYEAFVTDPVCEAQLVYLPFEHVNSDKNRDWFSEYMDMGLPIARYQDYDLSAESPDLAFFAKPFGGIPSQYYIDEVDKVVQRSVYIPYGIKWVNYKELPLLIDYHFRLPLFSKAWKIINAPNDVLENHIHYGHRNGENVKLIGHPRFDSVGKLGKMKDSIPLAWKSKIRGRKVIMWNTHFSNRSAGHVENDWATFEFFGRDILAYFNKNKEVVLLWRPHPLFLNGLVSSGIMTANEVEELKANIENSDNIILDTLADYRYAFSIADALISDASGLLPEFLMVEKPIMYTHPPGKYLIVNENQLPAYYKGGAWNDIEKFIEMVKEGKDYKLKERTAVMKGFGINSGKNIGKLVKDQCIMDIIDEETYSSNAH